MASKTTFGWFFFELFLNVNLYKSKAYLVFVNLILIFSKIVYTETKSDALISD